MARKLYITGLMLFILHGLIWSQEDEFWQNDLYDYDELAFLAAGNPELIYVVGTNQNAQIQGGQAWEIFEP